MSCSVGGRRIGCLMHQMDAADQPRPRREILTWRVVADKRPATANSRLVALGDTLAHISSTAQRWQEPPAKPPRCVGGSTGG